MFVAVISSLLMFALTWIIVSLLIALIWPYSRTEIADEFLATNIASFIGLIIAGLAAVHTFRASLKAKTGKLYKREKENGSIECENLKGPRARK